MGEGSRSALPIFGKFMQSVYTDKKLGYSPGPFPKPGIKITKEYQGCVSIGGIDAEGDSTALMGDSSSIIENVERLPSVEPIKRDTTIDNR
jgi:penicillin-binding protein 1A